MLLMLFFASHNDRILALSLINSFHLTMMSPSRAESASKPAPSKRSLFNKPSWSKTQPIGDAVDIFRRSDQTYADIVAEEEKKRNRRLARKEREQAKQNPDVAERAGKRRRISDYSEDEGDCSSSDTGGADDRPLELAKESVSIPPELESTRVSAENANQDSSPKSLLKRYESTITAHIAQEAKAQAPTVIDLEDDEEDQGLGPADDLSLGPPQVLYEQPTEAEDLLPSDEEFPELARQAREKARLKRMEEEREASAMLESQSTTTSNQKFEASEIPRQEIFPSPPPSDPIVEILITSRIPNTKPLIVSRKLTQRLKDVRVAWCQRQGFSAEAATNVFLTWRGKRLFDVTTCRSLGIGVDTNGNVALKGERDVLGEENRQIHMEAMTDEIMVEYKRGKHNHTGGGLDHTNEDHTEEEVVEQPKPPEGTKIILRSKDYADFKLIVKPVRVSHCCPSSHLPNLSRSLRPYLGSSMRSGQPRSSDQTARFI